MKHKFSLQEGEYSFPYHYLVDLQKYHNSRFLSWGLEYYCYMTATIQQISQLNYSTHLDIGCGDGRLIHELATKNPSKKYLGVDLSQPSIFFAQGCNYHLENTKFLCENFSLQTNEFDLITLNEVLEHIPDEEITDFCKQVMARMSDSGYLLVTVPTDNYPLIPKHYRHYKLDLLKQHFPNLTLKKQLYLYNLNPINKFIIAALSRINWLNPLEVWYGKTFAFSANQNNGKHLLCLFQKN